VWDGTLTAGKILQVVFGSCSHRAVLCEMSGPPDWRRMGSSWKNRLRAKNTSLKSQGRTELTSITLLIAVRGCSNRGRLTSLTA
jgi:hypothetical protein